MKLSRTGCVTYTKPARSMNLLRMDGIGKRFGATCALHNVSLAVEAGEVVALIGENGAGKSTLMKILSGAIAPDVGRMELAGRSYAPVGPQAALSAGVAMIYQELNLAPHLSVEDNVMLGQERTHWGLLRRSPQRELVRQALAKLGHGDLPLDRPVQELSIAAQQLVEIARALVLNAKVVVFDEPTSSLTQHDAKRLFEVIRKLRDSGIGVVYISHFLEEIREVCSRFVVLRDGEVVGRGALADVSEAEIIRLMVGRNVEELFPRSARTPGEVVLSLTNLSGRRSPRDVSLELRRGEILGIAGLVGAGRTELLRTTFGLDPIHAGTLRVGGVVPGASPHGRIRAGLGMVSEDRKTEGLAQSRSIADNLTDSRLAPYARWGWLNLRRRHVAVTQWMERLRIKARHPDQEVQHLSGGNQQKVALGRVLHQGADILLLDEPTRGIDVAAKAEIYRLIGDLAAAGKAIIFVSSYLPELLAMCDRLAVMSRGRVREIRPVQDWTEDTVLACAIGGE